MHINPRRGNKCGPSAKALKNLGKMEYEFSIIDCIKVIGDRFGYNTNLTMNEILDKMLVEELDEINSELSAMQNESIGFVIVNGEVTWMDDGWCGFY